MTIPKKLASLRQWTIFLDAKTLAPWRQGRLLGYGLDERRNNLSIDQLFDDLILRIRTDGDQRPRQVVLQKLFEQSTDRRFNLAVGYDGNDISVYVDGVRKIHQKIGPIDYSSWDDHYPLVLGSFANGKYAWKGIFYQLCVLDRAVTSQELHDPQGFCRDTTAVLHYSFDERNGTAVIDHSMTSLTNLGWPGEFSPYLRTVLQSPRDYWPNPRRPFIMDIIANIIIYLPIGYLLCVWIEQKKWLRFALPIPVLAALVLSLAIEVLQAYLPTRNSSTVDVFTNTLGSFFGAYVRRNGWTEVLLKRMNIVFGKAPPRSTT